MTNLNQKISQQIKAVRPQATDSQLVNFIADVYDNLSDDADLGQAFDDFVIQMNSILNWIK